MPCSCDANSNIGYDICKIVRKKMTVTDYVNKLKYICKYEFLSHGDLVRELDICHNTFLRIQQSPETCTMRTMRKIKLFVDKWEEKNGTANMSVKD